VTPAFRAFLVFLLSFGLGWFVYRATGRPAPPSVRGPSRWGDSMQVSLVFIGKQSCTWSNRPEIRVLLRQARRALQYRADSIGARVTMIGVGLDASPGRSARFLERIGDFDQILAGSAGPAGVTEHFLVSMAGGASATPQVLVVLHRRGSASGIAVSHLALTPVSDELVMRQVGLFELRHWVATGSRASLRPVSVGDHSH